MFLFNKKINLVSVFLIGILIFLLFKSLVQKWDYYFTVFDGPKYEEFYASSQYVKEDGGWLADEIIYSYAGWYYLNGGNPILVNPEHPPLAKYLIGFSIFLFNNEKIIAWFFGWLVLLGFFLLNNYFLKNTNLSLLILVVFSSGRLFQEQLLYLPQLELFCLTFLLFSIYFFLKGLTKTRYFLLSSFFLGCFISSRTWMGAIPIMATFFFYLLFLERKLKKSLAWGASLFLSLSILLASYFRLFVEGWGVVKVLSVQKWILWYQSGHLVKMGSVWPFIFLNRWYIWWGETPFVRVVQWRIFWPISVGLSIMFSLYLLLSFFKQKQKDPPNSIYVLVLYIIFYFVIASLGNFSVRYLFYIIPFCYLWSFYFLKKFLER